MPAVISTLNSLPMLAIEFVLVIFSIVVHEVSHGFVAYKCGDPTAKMSGRLTLNPLAHIDPFGTVLLPFILVLMGAPSFGYAKPVPYNPNYLKNRRRDEIFVALAGPASNLMQAFIAALIFKFLVQAAGFVVSNSLLSYIFRNVLYFLTFYVQVNVSLAVFNLIPIPPLDGSKVILYFLGDTYRKKFYAIEPYCMIVVAALVIFAPGIISSFISGISSVILRFLAGL
ncbi:MAG: site-2 protease family protein [Atopobiaceae bacterium]|nr:site-2 protease family protein [Atopobiaceae bacterium]